MTGLGHGGPKYRDTERIRRELGFRRSFRLSTQRATRGRAEPHERAVMHVQEKLGTWSRYEFLVGKASTSMHAETRSCPA